jgi:histone RNA hairpin-binding protein
LEIFSKKCELQKEDLETDAHKVSQRKKQLQFGYDTVGYKNIVAFTNKSFRGFYNKKIMKEPSALTKCSKRSFDGQLRVWRKNLHQWDEVTTPEKANELVKKGLEQYLGSAKTSKREG